MHTLLKTMASHRVRKRLAVPSSGKRARLRSEEGERAMVMVYLRRILSVTTIKVQCLLLLGRLEGQGPGSSAAINRHQQAANL